MSASYIPVPIFIGYDWPGISLTFPSGYLQAGETVRATLSKRPGGQGVDLVSVRDGDTITFTLPADGTADLEPILYTADLIVETDDGDDPANARLEIPVERGAASDDYPTAPTDLTVEIADRGAIVVTVELAPRAAEAVEAAETAVTKAAAAVTSAAIAEAAAERSEAAATDSGQSASDAAQSGAALDGAVATAETYRSEAQGSASDAAASADRASDSEGNALASEAAAANSASDAAASAYEADASATASAASADLSAASISAAQALLNNNLFPDTASALSNGVTSAASIVAGSGGTDGTFALGFSGGGGSGAIGRFVVSGGAVTQILIDNPGYNYTSAPTLSFAASSGLTGASATAVLGPRVSAGSYFLVGTSGATTIPVYRNVAGVAVDQNISVLTKAAADAAVGTVAGKFSSDKASGYVGGMADGRGRYIALFAADGSIKLKGLTAYSLSAPNGGTIANAGFSAGVAANYSVAWGDANGRLVAGIKTTGEFAVRTIVSLNSINGIAFSQLGVAPAQAAVAAALGTLSFSSGAPYGYSTAWVDGRGRVAGGIKTTGELATSRLVDVTSINGIAWPEVASGVSRGRFDAELNLFVYHGQSKPTGLGSTPILTTSQLYDGLRFSGGVRSYDTVPADRSAFVPLIETLGGSLGETPASGFNEMLKERILAENNLRYTDRPYQMVLACEAVGGLGIASLGVGTGPYNEIKADISAFRILSQAAGKSSKFRGFAWSQGETDYSGNTDATTYRNALTAMRSGLDTYAKGLNASNPDVLCFVDQVFAHYHYGHPNDPYLALAQLDLCNTDPLFTMVGNLSHLPQNGEPHWATVGSKWAGAFYARAYKRVVIDRGEWNPLQPVECFRDGTVAMIRFEPESGQLALDTTRVAAQTNMGLSLVDSGGVALTINSVALVGSDMVKVVAASAIPAGSFVRGGYTDTGRTNLRDTMGDTIVADMGGLSLRMDNWCVIFNQSLD